MARTTWHPSFCGIGLLSRRKDGSVILTPRSSNAPKEVPSWQKAREKEGKNMATGEETAKTLSSDQAASPWAAALSKLREWDPLWAEQAVKMTTNPWTEGALPTKFIELVSVGLNAAHTNLSPDGTRRHIRAAIAAGANRQEILFVLKCASVMSIHSVTFSAPILLQEASSGSLEDFSQVRAKRLQKVGEATPAVEKMKAIGQWSDEWDCLLFLAPVWTDQYMAMCIELYGAKVLSPKELELLLIAFDASYGNAYGPYTRHHIRNAFKAGATTDEIMQVLKLAVIRGMQACTLGVSILAEELERNAASQRASA
jgi:alkylhydroperoxidase/carboxymuconolactone decarboxylase family protein YurZ